MVDITDTVALYNEIQSMHPKYETFGDNLYWTWANWQMIFTYPNMGKSAFDKLYYMMRTKRFKQYQAGQFHITDLYELNKIKLRSGDYCFYCESRIPKNELTADHVFPRVKGGTNDLNNIIFVCKSCNSSKGKKELFKWFLVDRKEYPSPFVVGHYLRQIYQYSLDNNLMSMPFEKVESLDLPFNPRSVLLLHTKSAHRWYFQQSVAQLSES